MSGNLSRQANERALSAGMWTYGPNGTNAGDIVATVNATVTAGAHTSITTTALSRLIPDGSLCMIVAAGANSGVGSGGGIDGAQPPDVFVVDTDAASGATSITCDSRTFLAHTVGDQIIVLQASVPYLALMTATPADDSLGTEYTATGYARQKVTFTAPTDADPSATGNVATATFGPMSAGTGSTISYAVLMDCASAGTADNAGAWWTLTTAKTPGTGDSVTCAINSFTMTVGP